MNFITRNLGWILLLLFFIFMLFIISSNNIENLEEQGSGSIATESGSLKGELDEIAEKMKLEETTLSGVIVQNNGEEDEKKGFFGFLKKNEKKEDKEDKEDKDGNDLEKTNDIEEKEDNKNEISQEEEKEVKEEKKGILSKLFGGNKNVDNEPVTIDKEGSIEVDEDGEKKGMQDKKEITDDTSMVLLDKDSGLTKKTDKKKVVTVSKVARDIAPEIYGESELPGVNLKTAIGNTYKVGVYSLKLNNKYFSETLGYLKKGDKLLQKSTENMYGCFNVEVLSSENIDNNSKTGYVCKKWLEASDSAEEMEELDVSIEVKSIDQDKKSVPVTKIGDLIIIEKDFSSIGGSVTLVPGDVVDQMTPQDDSGCYVGIVRKTNSIEFMGRVLQLCQKDL